jgi:hypothetical protein
MLLIHTDGGETEGQVLGVRFLKRGGEDLPAIDHAPGPMQEDQHLPVPRTRCRHQIGAKSHQDCHLLILLHPT